MDSRLKSFSETGINLAVGYTINYMANITILPHFAKEIGDVNLWAFHLIGIIYTVISTIRQYGFRRLFERFGEKENFYTLTVRLINRLRRVNTI